MAAPTPLSPSSPLLRAGRFEVAVYGPKDPTSTARQRIAGPFRFASARDAELYAETLAGGLVITTNVRPVHPRYPDGPWRETAIAAVERIEVSQ